MSYTPKKTVYFVKISPFLLGVCLLIFSILKILDGRFLVKLHNKNVILRLLSLFSCNSPQMLRKGSRNRIVVGEYGSCVHPTKM